MFARLHGPGIGQGVPMTRKLRGAGGAVPAPASRFAPTSLPSRTRKSPASAFTKAGHVVRLLLSVAPGRLICPPLLPQTMLLRTSTLLVPPPPYAAMPVRVLLTIVLLVTFEFGAQQVRTPGVRFAVPSR